MGTIANAKVTHYYNCYNGDFIGCLLCISEDRDKFWDFIEKYKLDVIGLNIFSNWLTRFLGI